MCLSNKSNYESGPMRSYQKLEIINLIKMLFHRRAMRDETRRDEN